MTAREIVAFDEAGLELQSPQAGDTYVAKRAVHLEAALTTDSTIDGRDVAADGALAASATQPLDNISTLTNDMLASQAQAEAGTENTKTMTALRVAQAITAFETTLVNDKLDATVAPLPTDDNTYGYGIRSFWCDLTANNVYVCIDASTNTAIWINIGLAVSDLATVAGSGDSDDLSEGTVNLLLTAAERVLIATALQPDAVNPYSIMSVQAGVAGEATVDGTPRQIAAWNTNGLSEDCVADHTTDDITIATAGVYEVNLTASFSGSASKTYVVEIYKNGLTTGFAFERKLGTGGDVGSASCNGLVSCIATDTIEAWQSSTDGGSAMTLSEAQLLVHRVGP